MGALFSFVGGFYYWGPSMFGLNYNKVWAEIHFWLIFISVNIIFLPMHFLGQYLGLIKISLIAGISFIIIYLLYK